MSMMGSGIYSRDVSYDEFTCDNEDCGKDNPAGDTATDDWGNYEIVCEFCGCTYNESSLSDDRESAREDADYDAYKERDL